MDTKHGDNKERIEKLEKAIRFLAERTGFGVLAEVDKILKGDEDNGRDT